MSESSPGMSAAPHKLGHTVGAIVRPGREAVQQAGGLRPDLVLMDIGLPGEMEGIEAATRIEPRILDRVLGAHGLVTLCVPPPARKGEPDHASPRYASRGVQA